MAMPAQRHRISCSPRLDAVLAASLTLGAVLALIQARFWPLWSLGLLFVMGAIGLLLWPRLRAVSGLALGFAWAMVNAFWGMEARLPMALEGVDLTVEGRVLGLPERRGNALRFTFKVTAGEGAAQVLDGHRLRLSWYRGQDVPEPGSQWRLMLRLKRPRGTLNPGGMDFERYALERGIVAIGHVREGPETRALHPGRGIDAWRLRLSERMALAVKAPSARFVQALGVGDTRALDGADWHVLRATGIAHLIAISGLHVGMVAGFGALLMRWAYRLRPGFGLRLPLPQAAAWAGLLWALAYTALAGFALPTVRTLLMIAAALLAVLLRRRFDSLQSLALALIAVLGVDPLAVLDAGFWLSFLGVAWLLWCLPRVQAQAGWRSLVSAQGVMTFGLLPLTVWFFGQASVVGPLCNLIAVPWVSFIVVPLALIGTALELVSAGAGSWPLQASAWLMQLLWNGLEPLGTLHGALVWLPEPTPVAFLLALLGAFWLLLPRVIPGKGLALLLFAPLLWPNPPSRPEGTLDLSLLDVGQGLSILLRSARHAVLIDAGAAFPGGLDMGEAAVVPALRALGVQRLDLFIISHADNDHAGGAQAVQRALAPARILVSRNAPRAGEEACRAGFDWRFDGLRLRLLHPPLHMPYLGNESSCVVRIESQDGTALALLPGDIGKLIEQRLLREQPQALSAPVLVAPHHGSRSSSSDAFIEAVAPQQVLVAAGYRNRFQLPSPEILARYQARAMAILNTADTGAIHLRIDAEGIQSIQTERQRRPRLWREAASASTGAVAD